ncbi:MAG TPA: carbamoyltransferase HypF [Candidatus Binataceae bacterium]|nr:carbamoyltransferase HypF [Candidatus Binataceae bacterium]
MDIAVSARHGSGADRRPSEPGGLKIGITGISQGIGFRPFVYRLAREEGLTGSVRNDGAGVTIEVFGSRAGLDRFVSRLTTEAPEPAQLKAVRASLLEFEQRSEFEIAPSQQGRERRVSIPADLAVCPACVAEIFDRDDRRFGYAFTNCTNCGPRFTIARDVPYDRGVTTMAPFEMCAECLREYEDPGNRRFHAEPNACPECGPRLRLLEATGAESPSNDALQDAARAMCEGSIVALKGIGGFHLACDATSSSAVARLRLRKHRDEKPFAVMVRELEDAERLAALCPAERALLCSPERPIVLAHRHPDANLAAEVAPESLLVGIMLAYTPLHHLLLAAAQRPLVMTSGNRSDEAIAYRDEEALLRLAGIADAFLIHDREIVTRCDDSVARIIAGAPTVLRRSRGYVPRPLPVDPPFERPVLAVGAQLKNSFCLGIGDAAWFGPHLGDLDGLEIYEAFEESIARLETFVGARPEIIAHDLHPDYLSTRYARERRECAAVAVQHHHAHVASAMAEHGLAGPVLGLAFDGSGLGSDGAMWGGELLCADFAGFERVATLRPIALAGGDRAVREVWRLALALIDDAFGGSFDGWERIELFSRLDGGAVTVVRRMMASGLNTASAHGVGRYFDAIGALVLARQRATYEGQIALMLNNLADPGETGEYEFCLDRAERPWRLDLRPMVRRIVREVMAGADPRRIAARFHNTLVAGAATMVRAALAERGALPVVLSGGCFQNPRLAEGVAAALHDATSVHLHRSVPSGDGGIALGQAMVARILASGVTANKYEEGPAKG